MTLGHEFFEDEKGQEGMDQKTVDDYNEVLAYQAYPQIRKLVTGSRYRFFVENPDKPTQQFDAHGILPNLKVFAEAAKYAGFINAIADSDSTFRHMPLVMRYPEKVKTSLAEENFFPSLAIQTTRTYLNAGPDDTIFYFGEGGPERLQMGRYTIKTDRTGEVLVNFAGEGELPHVSVQRSHFRQNPGGEVQRQDRLRRRYRGRYHLRHPLHALRKARAIPEWRSTPTSATTS